MSGNIVFENQKISKNDNLEIRKLKFSVFVLFALNQRLICCFPNRGDEVSMCHSKEIENGCINIIFKFGGTEPPFQANLLFGYAQSGSERSSFSGSTVRKPS